MSSKIQKRKMTAEMPYDALLTSYTAGDLKEMCKLWGMKGYSKMKKEEMIEALVAHMDSNFEDRFLRMNLDHFTVINELAKGNNVFLSYPMAASELTGLGMIIEGLIDGEKQVMMPRKVYDQFGELYGKYHEVLTLNTILKDYMELSIELYGVMTVEAFVENFYKFNEEAMDRELIKDAMTYTIMRTKNTVQTGDYLHYYRLGEFEKVYGDIQTKTEIDYKTIDHDLLQKFIQSNNSFWNENHVKLEKVLVERFKGDHDMMIDTMDELRVMASYNHGVADFIQLFTKKRDDAKMDDIKVFADLIITINNEMPHWELKGYAPAELSQYQKMQPIVKGDKIGRNDPCPCGSGKKYKKCCLNK